MSDTRTYQAIYVTAKHEHIYTVCANCATNAVFNLTRLHFSEWGSPTKMDILVRANEAEEWRRFKMTVVSRRLLTFIAEEVNE